MSVLQSHLTRHYLWINVQIYMEITTSTLDLDMATSLGQSTCLSHFGRSSVGPFSIDLVALRSSIDLDLCIFADTLSALHIIISFPGRAQVIYCITIAPQSCGRFQWP